MAVLDQLTLSSAAPKRDTSPLGRFRRKIVDAIDQQVAMARAAIDGTEYRRTRQRWIRNDAGGKELREVPVRLRPWWWADDAGTVHLTLRSGGRVVEVAPGKTSIEIGTVDELPGKLAILRDAVRAGELDGCMNAAPRRVPKKAGEGALPGTPPAVPRKGPRKSAEAGRPASA